MSLTDMISIAALVTANLGAIVGSTWLISGKLERVHSTVQYAKEQFEIHRQDDQKNFDRQDRRFNELNTQITTLARQHFKT